MNDSQIIALRKRMNVQFKREAKMTDAQIDALDDSDADSWSDLLRQHRAAMRDHMTRCTTRRRPSGGTIVRCSCFVGVPLITN